MEWGLFVVAVLLVAALQFAVWRRLQHGDLGASESRPSTEPPRAADRQHRDADAAGDPDVRLCPACGAQNDADYRFCWDCTSALQP
ncbi:DUF7577 domain-containing protein [Halobacterium yunchengense]|uniref:DUF7577 domain-containing protein n=1 Tax=Halobacterium yunchengense TaxID=3108497 RepID=UPI00300BDC65